MFVNVSGLKLERPANQNYLNSCAVVSVIKIDLKPIALIAKIMAISEN